MARGRRRRGGFFRRRRARSHASYRRRGRRAVRALAPIRRFGAKLGAAFPSWAKPSKVTAITGVSVGIAELVVTPLSNGDSWITRLKNGYATYKTSGNPMDILDFDAEGNNAATVAVAQLKQNAPGSIFTMVGFGVGAAFLKWVGM